MKDQLQNNIIATWLSYPWIGDGVTGLGSIPELELDSIPIPFWGIGIELELKFRGIGIELKFKGIGIELILSAKGIERNWNYIFQKYLLTYMVLGGQGSHLVHSVNPHCSYVFRWAHQ